MIDGINISRHWVIEASAGTGKTYTIENLFVDILLGDPALSPGSRSSTAGAGVENILVLTFTEKATGELRRRIRKKLQDELRSSGHAARNDRIAAALNNFDSATICTIHGFCQRVLQQYAFENSIPFTTAMTENEALCDRLFAGCLREAEQGGLLASLSDQDRARIAEKEFYRSAIVHIASNLMPGDRLEPTEDDLRKVGSQIRLLLDELTTRIGDVPDNLADSRLLSQMTGSNVKGRNEVRRQMERALAILRRYQLDPGDPLPLRDFACWIASLPEAALEAASPKPPLSREVCSALLRLLVADDPIEALRELRRICGDGLSVGADGTWPMRSQIEASNLNGSAQNYIKGRLDTVAELVGRLDDPDTGQLLAGISKWQDAERSSFVKGLKAITELAEVPEILLSRLLPALKTQRVEDVTNIASELYHALHRNGDPLQLLQRASRSSKKDAEHLQSLVDILEDALRTDDSVPGRLLQWLGSSHVKCRFAEHITYAPALPEYVSEVILSFDSKDLPTTTDYGFMDSMIQRLRKLAAERKEADGLIDFSDMLVHTRKALEASPSLVGVLRERFHYALLDEFQDTDPVQWDIFRMIFAEDGNGRLSLVGDPKQAIYGFRGANVETYRSACSCMIDEHGAGIYPLKTNWRSCRGMIDALNKLFVAGEWFGGDSITYENVSYPDGRKEEQVGDELRPPLVIRDVSACDKASDARQEFARYAAAEIGAILKAGAAKAEDICILYRGGSDLPSIEAALSDAGVPYTLYKKGGLFQSDEAAHLLYLLEAIAYPSDRQRLKRALMTRFFAVSPEDVLSYDEMRSDHPVKQLLLRWREAAEKRDWPRMFRSVFSGSKVLLREIGLRDGERRVTNFRHIGEKLQTEAIAENLDIVDIATRLDSYMRRLESKDETNLHRLDSETGKVKVLTMHAAKGLEFDVVFVAGGFTEGSSRDPYYTHSNGAGKTYDLAKLPRNKLQAENERQDEERRLMYVALTRAKHRLYLPKARSNWRSPGCLSDFVLKSIQAAWPDGIGDDNVRFESPGDAATLLGSQDNKVGAEAVAAGRDGNDTERSSRVRQDVIDGLGGARLVPSFRYRVVGSESFSSLHNRRAAAVSAGEDRKEATLDDLESVTIDSIDGEEQVVSAAEPLEEEYASEAAAVFAQPDIPIPPPRPAGDDDEPGADDGAAHPAPRLPRGEKTGSMLHAVLQYLDFASVVKNPDRLMDVDDPAGRLIAGCLEQFNIRDKDDPENTTYRQLVVDMVRPALCEEVMPGLRIGEIPAERRIAEMEFHYPFPGLTDEMKRLGIESREGFINGVIDLVFQHEGRYYILDWKSNWSEDGYSEEAIQRIMCDRRYHLQYQVYWSALRRWLEKTGFDRDRDFGGVIYVFLRGAEDGGKPGVFFRDSDDVLGGDEVLAQLVHTGKRAEEVQQ